MWACACVCFVFLSTCLLVAIVTALSLPYEKALRSIQPHISWAAPCCLLFPFHRSPLFPASPIFENVKEVIEVVQMVSTESWEAKNGWSVYSRPCRCFSSADKYPSEEEHLCRNSLLDGSWGTVKPACKRSCSLFPFHYISPEQIPVGTS